jgi:hypothetical protein
MPFILETDAAVAIIDRALQRRRRLVRFPWSWTLLLRCVASLPAVLSSAERHEAALTSRGA